MMVSLNSLTITLACAINLVHASWSFPDGSCDQGKKDILTQEIGYAFDMANSVSAQFASDDNPDARRQYYIDFINEDDRKDQVNSQAMFQLYTNIALMLDTNPPHTDYDFTITCDSTTTGCTTKGFKAHMNDNDKRMNFCDYFFSDGDVGKAIVATEKARGACITDKENFDLRAAQWTRSAIIVHECTHTNYVMGSLGATKDFAYGFNGNYLLPRGLFNRACAKYAVKGKILCPDTSVPPNESVCLASNAIINADTYSFIAAGIYYSGWCGAVKYPELPDTTPARVRRSRNARNILQRDFTCPDYDAIWFDGTDDDDE